MPADTDTTTTSTRRALVINAGSAMGALATDAAVLTSLHHIQRMEIPRQDPGLHHVACFAVAGVQRRNRDDRLAIKGARPFMQHIALGHHQSEQPCPGASYGLSQRQCSAAFPPPNGGCGMPTASRDWKATSQPLSSKLCDTHAF